MRGAPNGLLAQTIWTEMQIREGSLIYLSLRSNSNSRSFPPWLAPGKKRAANFQTRASAKGSLYLAAHALRQAQDERREN